VPAPRRDIEEWGEGAGAGALRPPDLRAIRVLLNSDPP